MFILATVPSTRHPKSITAVTLMSMDQFYTLSKAPLLIFEICLETLLTITEATVVLRILTFILRHYHLLIITLSDIKWS